MITEEEYKQLEPYFKEKTKRQIWNIINKLCKEKAIKEKRIIIINEIIQEVLK